MRLRAVMFDSGKIAQLVRRMSDKMLHGEGMDAGTRARFEESATRLLQAFAEGGYARIAELIEQLVPEQEREGAAQAYIKIVVNAGFEALVMSREQDGKPAPQADEATMRFLRQSLNSMSDLFFYGAPFYLELTGFEQRQASGFQLTRSPGKNLVYSGSMLLVLGIFAMIYLRERRIWLLVQPASQRVLFAMSASRKSRDFEFEFARYRDQLQGLIQG